MSKTFWGPERLNSAAFVELVELIDSRAEVDAILRALDGVTDVVDVGGGTGFLTQQIAKLAPVIVIEPSKEQRARVPSGITVRSGRAESLPLPDASVDAAIATWVLQYCDDPLKAVDELARVARNRVVIVQAAPHNDLVVVYNLEAVVAGRQRADHEWLLSNASSRLVAAGFTVAIERVAIPVRAPNTGIAGRAAHAMAAMLSRLHFADHPERASMIAATEPFIARQLAANGALADDGAILVARR